MVWHALLSQMKTKPRLYTGIQSYLQAVPVSSRTYMPYRYPVVPTCRTGIQSYLHAVPVSSCTYMPYRYGAGAHQQSQSNISQPYGIFRSFGCPRPAAGQQSHSPHMINSWHPLQDSQPSSRLIGMTTTATVASALFPIIIMLAPQASRISATTKASFLIPPQFILAPQASRPSRIPPTTTIGSKMPSSSTAANAKRPMQRSAVGKGLRL